MGATIASVLHGLALVFLGGGLVCCTLSLGAKLSGDYQRSVVPRRALTLGLTTFALAGLAFGGAVALRSVQAIPT